MKLNKKLNVFGGFSLLLIGAVGAAQGVAQTAASGPLPETIQFNRDIRPILSDNCFTCHGPDKSHRTTVFHFDIEEAAKQDIGGRFAILPGDPARSVMIQRVTDPDERRRMPPVSTGHKLSEHQIALLTKWIEQGAKWEKPWSFIPPERPRIPQVANAAWARNPIDNFILHRLEQEGLKPSPEANRTTLLRRVTLDLVGRAPAPAEIDAFLADKSPNAYEKVVDRLLESPQYGERMAVPWLDAARYADTNGYQQDHDRYMWRWRDWVINAFNRNLPYDRFVIEQLAGDLLPNPTLDQKIATGFNRNHRTNAEGGIIAAEFAPEYVVDRVATTSSAFLGLTLGCARCHDHKYDPFTQKEFYQLFAYFNNIPESGYGRRGNSDPYIKAPTTEQQAVLKQLDGQIDAANARFTKLQPALASSEAAWLKSISAGPRMDWAPSQGLIAYYPLNGNLQGTVAQEKEGAAPPVAKWMGDEQFSNGAVGQAASFDGKSEIEVGQIGDFVPISKFSMGAWIYPTEGSGPIINRFQGEVRAGGNGYSLQLKDGKLEMIYAYRVPDHCFWVQTQKPMELNRWHHVAVSFDGVRNARNLILYVDGVAQATEILRDVLNETNAIEGPFRIGGVNDLRFHGLIDEVRVYNTNLSAEDVRILSVSKSLNELAGISPVQRTPAEEDKVRRAFLASGSASAQLRDAFLEWNKLREQRAKFYEDVPTVMVMEEMPTRRETHVLIRGAYDQPGEVVTPGVPAILPSMPDDLPRNRLGLAQWIVAPSNPLTARVAVNRYWQMYFGTGIVKTVDDFGSQGESPSHPELLDWLATEFMRTGWNVKEMQKTIVTSATYRQASQTTPEMVQRDPENRLLARGARYRLPAETVRDQALSLAGLLAEKLGGPSVKSYQPPGIWSDLAWVTGYYQQDHGDSLYRRSLYSFWKRTIPPPSMANFDAPSRESCILQRGLTNSPLQALDLMNDVSYLEAARLVGERMMKEGGSTPEERIRFAFRLATGRLPSASEARVLTDSFHYSLDRFETRPDAATDYLKQGEYPRDEKLDAKELAAYSRVASLILNLDETVTRE